MRRGSDRWKLFLPKSSQPLPAVIIVPGSLGVSDNHLAHAETLLNERIAVFVLDPFANRGVDSTVANQTQYSFAASAFDVLAALRTISQFSKIDSNRISAQGHSRGGSAVLTAAERAFAEPIVGPDYGFKSVYAVYPWCGHQFETPDVGGTTVRAIIGELDEWVSVQQIQSQIQAINLCGGEASVRIVTSAAHSFDKEEEVHMIPEASVSPNAPLRPSTTTICGFLAKNWVSSGTQTSPNDPKFQNASAKLHLLNWFCDN